MATTTSEPLTAELPGLAGATLCEAFQLTAERFAGQPALRAADGSGELTWAQYAQRVRALAGGLAGLGVQLGDTVALLLDCRPEFNLFDAAVLHLGATPFSIYNTSSPEQIEYVLGNAGARVVVTEPRHLDSILAVKDCGARIDRIVLVEGTHPEALTVEDLEAAAPAGFDFEAAWRAVEPSDIATLIYTSGTTGPPKGVELTHANLMAQWRSLAERVPPVPGGRVVAYLPAAHVADRVVSHYQGIVSGACVTSLADPKQLAAVLPSVRPTTWMAVPRIWEKFMAAIQAQLGAEHDDVIAAGVRAVRAEQAGEELDAETAAGRDRALAIGAAVREKLGLGDAVNLLSGAAPIPVEVLEFFAALGMPISEAWGMSECAGVSTINPPGALRFGTVGTVIEGVEVKIAEDGELLARGPNVMAGYRNDPERTAETIDADGWLHTGDVAEVDADGYVRIVDRKKELIINAAGKNMSPANIEQKLKAASPLIGQACVIGDARPYNVALLVLDPDAAAAWAARHGREDATAAALCLDAELNAEVREAVDAANLRMARVEQIKKFRILPTDWLPDSDELTPTMKLKRRPIAEKYGREIEELYAR